MQDSADMLVKKVTQKPNVIVRKEENCYLLVNRKTRSVMVIDNVGFDVWNLLTGITVEEVVKKLADKYTVETSICQEEVLRFIQKLDANGFIGFFF